VAHEIAATEPRIDVLIPNAGAMFNRRIMTADGLEKTFALNHMGYFIPTLELLSNIVDGGRIVVTASNAHRGAVLDFGDLQSAHGYSGFPVYSRSKLMNILFTRALSRRLTRGITANALHPGFVATRFGDQSGGIMAPLLKVVKPVGAISPERGAQTVIWLASAPEAARVNGGYFFACKSFTPTVHALNDADGEKLWAVSEDIAGRV
jgi:NAD(P)-dependent dehydrogenase (short-subunit alcohol dehydrogenase family)